MKYLPRYKWEQDALCDGSPMVFVSDSRADELEARKACNECPVRAHCRLYGLIYGEYGVWGGTLKSERDKISPVAIDFIRNQFLALGLLETRRPVIQEFLRRREAQLQEQSDPI